MRRTSDARRASSTDRGYDWRWRRYRADYLTRHPLCMDCLEDEERFTASTDVDHVIPATPDEPLFWDETNHRARCHSHHSSKTAKHDGGFGNPVHV